MRHLGVPTGGHADTVKRERYVRDVQKLVSSSQCLMRKGLHVAAKMAVELGRSNT